MVLSDTSLYRHFVCLVRKPPVSPSTLHCPLRSRLLCCPLILHSIRPLVRLVRKPTSPTAVTLFLWPHYAVVFRVAFLSVRPSVCLLFRPHANQPRLSSTLFLDSHDAVVRKVASSSVCPSSVHPFARLAFRSPSNKPVRPNFLCPLTQSSAVFSPRPSGCLPFIRSHVTLHYIHEPVRPSVCSPPYSRRPTRFFH